MVNSMSSSNIWRVSLSVGLAFFAATLQDDQRRFCYGVGIFYSPILTSRSEPLTRASIEGQYDITSCLQRKTNELVELLRRLDGPAESLDQHQIRMKIVLSDSEILLDLYGNVQEGKNIHKIDRSTQLAIRKLVKSYVPDG